MGSREKIGQMSIAPHYYWVQDEFARLRGKLAAAMVRPARPMGLEIMDGRTALQIWEKGLQKRTKKISSLLHVFSNTILVKHRKPSRLQTEWALIPLEQEVNHLIALHRQLWQQPFSYNYHEGQVLFSCCIEKIATDLDDLFNFFISTMEQGIEDVDARTVSHIWDKEISCRTEMTEYKSWFARNADPLVMAKRVVDLPCILHGLFTGVARRGRFLPDFSA
ncbi:MAG: hypothetical protein KKD73_10320 [Proteobacteria bacterium]|nr:hypothetical protein [Pseudomonadota bacterium]MBU1640820.1 hypothetical protein [Pseudomonadota bacterium]